MEKTHFLEKEILILLQQNRFLDALRKIDHAIDEDPNNHHFYYLRGAANLFLQRVDDALMDLGESACLNPQHLPTMHALAYIFLKKEDYEGALNKWISILEIKPNDKLAKKHLNHFKKTPPSKASLNLNPELYLELPKMKIRETSAKKPGRKALRPFLLWARWLLIPAVLLIGFWSYRYFKGYAFQVLPEFHFSNPEIAYSFTEKELEFYKKQAYDLISRQQYNQAKILLNKFYLSNAGLEDKKLLKTWESRLEFPNASNLDVRLTPEEVFASWRVAEGCFVLWSGKAEEVVQKPQYLFFLLNVGESRKVGAVLFSNFPVQNGEKVKVLGRIRKTGEKEIELEIYQIEKI